MIALVFAMLETVRHLGRAAMERFIFHDRDWCNIHIAHWQAVVRPLVAIFLLELAYMLREPFYRLLIWAVEGI